MVSNVAAFLTFPFPPYDIAVLVSTLQHGLSFIFLFLFLDYSGVSTVMASE